jgi:D-alanyl-D-alanine dipeptidase
MIKLHYKIVVTFITTLFFVSNCMALPDNFVYLEDVDPSIIQEIKYFTHDNFIGRPIAGYETARCILTRPAALALTKIQKQLQSQSLSLKVFDCYRPQTAVNDFIKWSQDASDQKMKATYYPRINKADVFTLGYVAEKSGHTRGSTVDLTIVRVDHQSINELAMGTHFDFMDERSHYFSDHIQNESRENRQLLRTVMQTDFEPYDMEWWHFTLKNEPFPETYFDFAVK